MAKLNALAVRAATKPGRYHDGRGLMLVVKPGGSRSWVVRLQVDGKRRDFGLGPAADVSLVEAREKADAIRKLYRSGVDPVAAKRAEKAARNAISTFAEAAVSYHAEQESTWRNAKHRAQWLSSLNAYAFPAIGRVRVDEIDGPMIRDLLLPIWLEKPETARRVRQRIGAVLDWCHAKGLRPTEAPMRSLSKGLPRQPRRDRHFSAMPFEDVPSFMVKLGESDSVGRLALQFVILTAARSGEARGAIWEEIDREAGTWTIPANRMKGGREHIVPLCEAVIAILDRAKLFRTGRLGEPVFPGQGGRVMSDMTLAKALKTSGASDVTVHGFRSSFRDWAAETTGFSGDVVEAALAHTVRNKVEAAYRRTNYLEKRRLLMDAWARFLLPFDGNVVHIRPASGQ